jgi:hypothetical protein
MQQHHTRAVAKLAVADGRAVFRGYSAGYIVFPLGYCRLNFSACCIDFHLEFSFSIFAHDIGLFFGLRRHKWLPPFLIPGKLTAAQIGDDRADPFQLGFKHGPHVFCFKQEEPG